MKTVLITGSSSGYGLATARHFHELGWNVIATMRTPRPDLFPASDRMRLLALDVTNEDSIAAAVAGGGPIDVLVNNAGIGAAGVFEAVPMRVAREVFETNTFGVMAMTQAVIPGMRERGGGVIVNVTSSAVLAPKPLVAIYTASKMAIEGFTMSLALELASVGVRAKIVQPGYGPTTAFTANTGDRLQMQPPEAYAAYVQGVFAQYGSVDLVTTEVDVAEGVLRAATDTSDRLRFPAGADAVALAKGE